MGFDKVLLFIVVSLSFVSGDLYSNSTWRNEGPPRLELVLGNNNKYHLDVYNPDSLANYNQSAQRITNPSCMLEGGSLLKQDRARVILEYTTSLEWEQDARSMQLLEYSLRKHVYKIIVEGEGYIQCKASVDDYEREVETKKKLYRYTEHVFSVHILYDCLHNPAQCNDISRLSKNLTYNFNKYITTTYLKINNIRAIPISATLIGNTSYLVIYRIEVTMFDEFMELLKLPRESAKGTQPDRKMYKDWELLLFLVSISSRYVKESQNQNQTIIYIRSTRYCHKYIAKAVLNGVKMELNWPTTLLGEKQVPVELCVTKEGKPIVVECVGDYIVGAYWDNNVTLFQCESTAARTATLHQLATETQRARTSLAATRNLLTPDSRQSALTDADITYVADIMTNIATETMTQADLAAVANITNLLMLTADSDRADMCGNNRLKSAQEDSNSSNKILAALDRILNDFEMKEKSQLIVTERFVTLVVDLSAEESSGQIRGLAALKREGNPDDTRYFKQSDIIPLTSLDNLDSLLELDASVGVLLPPQLLEDNRSHRLVISLFKDASLFGTRHTSGLARQVLSVTLDGRRHHDLNPPLILVFAREDGNRVRDNNSGLTDSPCVFWDFTASSWSTVGCTLASPLPSHPRADVCVCTHLTHFAELLHAYPPSPDTVTALDVITVVGCCLSLLGLLGIALTAIVFPDWRHGASKKVQLNLCAALAALMASFLVSTFDVSGAPCLVNGIALHYSVLASFCWMVVAAWGQYRRLTRPLESLNRRPHFLLKACVFAWGVPFVPWITVLVLDKGMYDPPNCYPVGYYLYFSVLVPVTMAVSLNGTIFLLIMFSIYNCCGFGIDLVHLRNNQSERSKAFRKALTAMFLFLLLGLSWVFGILRWSYVFCLTATLQGLAVFVFFVVLDKKTRMKWSRLVSKKKEKQFRCSSYNSSSDFIRRWPSTHGRQSRNANTRISTISE